MDKPQDTKSARILKIEEWRCEVDEVRRELTAAASGPGGAAKDIAIHDIRRRIVNLNRRISRTCNKLAAASVKDAGDEIGNCKSNRTVCAKPVSAERQIVLDALLDPQKLYEGKSERYTAMALGVSTGLVHKVRRELTATAQACLASDDLAIAEAEKKIAELTRDKDNVFPLIERQGFRSFEAIKNSCDLAHICIMLERRAYEKLHKVLAFMFPDMQRERLGLIVGANGEKKALWPSRPFLHKTRVSPDLYEMAAE